jgi:hypothetical protein
MLAFGIVVVFLPVSCQVVQWQVPERRLARQLQLVVFLVESETAYPHRRCAHSGVAVPLSAVFAVLLVLRLQAAEA